jgi:hypothetical protein
MKTKITENSKGEFEFTKISKNWDFDYGNSLIKYLNCINTLFNRAKEVSEFDFILTILGVRGLRDPGCEPFANTIDIFNLIVSLKSKARPEFVKLNLFLWLYGHIVEASEPYEIFANLLRICNGDTFNVKNFPDKKRGKHTIPQYPAEKIGNLEDLAKKVQMQDTLIPIKEVFDRELRNSIFHSDYSIYNGAINTPQKHIKRDETYLLIKRAFAYFEAIKYLYYRSIGDYDKPKIVQIPNYYSSTPHSQGVAVTRKNYGLIGIKDNLSQKELHKGSIPFLIGRYKKHELKILELKPSIAEMPEDKVEILYKRHNKFSKWVPKRVAKYLNKWFEKKVKRTEKKLIDSTVYSNR